MNHRTATKSSLAIIVGHHLVQNLVLNERGYVAGNLMVSVLLVGVGRASGLSFRELGLQPGDLRRGARIGAGAATAGAAAGLLALSNRQTRELLRDERATIGSDAEVWRRALVRFPLGTALFEEVAFRGVLPAVLGLRHRPLAADTMSAALFGLWHLIPTARALAGNPVGQGMGAGRRTAVILGGSTAAGLAGLALSRLRRGTGSLFAPWLVHASFNTLSYLSAVAALRLPQRLNQR